MSEQLQKDLQTMLQIHGRGFWTALASLASDLGHCACGRRPFVRNIGSSHFAMCDVCQTYWQAGQDVIPGWENETPVDWERTAALLASYRHIQPKSPIVLYGTALLMTDRQIEQWVDGVIGIEVEHPETRNRVITQILEAELSGRK